MTLLSNLISAGWGLLLSLPFVVAFCLSLYLLLSTPHNGQMKSLLDSMLHRNSKSSHYESKLQNCESRITSIEQTLEPILKNSDPLLKPEVKTDSPKSTGTEKTPGYLKENKQTEGTLHV